jgi:hypothetical protein
VEGNGKLEKLDRPHTELANGLCDSDVVGAAEAMRDHVHKSLQRTMIRLDAYFQLDEKNGRRFVRKRDVPVLGG